MISWVSPYWFFFLGILHLNPDLSVPTDFKWMFSAIWVTGHRLSVRNTPSASVRLNQSRAPHWWLLLDCHPAWRCKSRCPPLNPPSLLFPSRLVVSTSAFRGLQEQGTHRSHAPPPSRRTKRLQTSAALLASLYWLIKPLSNPAPRLPNDSFNFFFFHWLDFTFSLNVCVPPPPAPGCICISGTAAFKFFFLRCDISVLRLIVFGTFSTCALFYFKSSNLLSCLMWCPPFPHTHCIALEAKKFADLRNCFIAFSFYFILFFYFG